MRSPWKVALLPQKPDNSLREGNLSLFSPQEAVRGNKLPMGQQGLSVDTQEDFLAPCVSRWNALVSRHVGSPPPGVSDTGMSCFLGNT